MTHAFIAVLMLAELQVVHQHGQSARSIRAQLSPHELHQVVEIIAHDSMGGRATPSRELEAAAHFVASRYRAAGLMPLGDDSGYFQRFPVLHTSVVESKAGLQIGSLATWRFGDDYWHVGGMGGAPFGELKAPVVVVAGNVTRENAQQLDVRKKIVIYKSPLNERGTPTRFDAGFALGAAGALAVLVPGERPDSLWQRIREDPDELKPKVSAAWDPWTERSAPLGENVTRFMPVLEVWSGRFRELVRKAGADTTAFATTDATPTVTPLGLEGVFRFERKTDSISWAPNVVGLVTGSDPVLKHEYVVITAHLDHLGRSPNGPPGPAAVFNGADDNASGVAALLQMAATITAGPRPKRSVLFVVVSGEELGLWGSDYFAARPPVPPNAIVANINLDMIGRASGDTLYVTGNDHPKLRALTDPVLERARKGLKIIDEAGLQARYPLEHFDDRSDHVNFRRRGIPAISFFTGTHADYHRTTDDPEKLNYEALSRIANLAVDITLAIANARPIR